MWGEQCMCFHVIHKETYRIAGNNYICGNLFCGLHAIELSCAQFYISAKLNEIMWAEHQNMCTNENHQWFTSRETALLLNRHP